MTTKPASPPHSGAAAEPARRLTLLPDPPQCPDMAAQYPHISRAHLILEDWLRAWPDALVMGAGYLCYDAGDIRRAPYPDCLVSLGVAVPPADIVASNGYMISEVGKPPDLVLEVASASTGRRDYTVKREIYARYEIKEYWRFDHTGGRYHDAPLAGDERDADGRWRPIPITPLPGGGWRGYSRVLGLELHWVDGNLLFWNPATGEYLPDLSESKAQTVAERVARQVAEAQATAERTARQDAEVQRDDAIAERDANAAERDANAAERDANAAALQEAEERIRRLEERLRRQSEDQP